MKKKYNTIISVSKIIVDKLFGLYDYTLPRSINSDIKKLMIVYGDNGSGKTTILKLFFYLLSTRDRSGYKSRIAETKFQKFAVVFQNGIEIGAQREKPSIGTYEFYIARKGKKIKSLSLKAAADNAINIESGSKDYFVYQEMLEFIRQLNITTFYLSDDRKILNSLTSNINEPDERDILFNDSDIIFSKKYERIEIKKIMNEKRLALEPTIERLIDWIRNKIISGSRMGEKNSQVIFSDIIKNYIKLSESESRLKDEDSILKELIELENKIPIYVVMGLIDELDTKGIRNSIKKAKTDEQIKFLSTVISPFLESVNAKLNALEYVVRTINLFLETVNGYFTNKIVNFHLSKGFTLSQTNDGEIIDFNWLSSGEKQLLLLLINTITSADDATIFIIDEPEISLNIKWQRKLIKTLLDFSAEKNIQFILATHSFELLSAYKNSITKLESDNA
jgi:AAA15 family ATPase/GTPase